MKVLIWKIFPFNEVESMATHTELADLVDYVRT